MDVKIEFLNRELYEEIYRHQPIGFELKKQKDRVYKLKILYMTSNNHLDSGTLSSIMVRFRLDS